MTRLVINPMIRKEILLRLRERRAWLLPTLYLLLVAGSVLFAYYVATARSSSDSFETVIQGADIGLALFMTVTFAQIGVLLFMCPVFSAGSITIEKEQRTLAGLLTSLLSSPQIWWGKFVTALMYLLLLLCSGLPLLILSFTFGGVDVIDFVKATAISVLVISSLCAIGLWCSSAFRRSVHSTATAYAIVLILCVLSTIVFAILASRPAVAAMYGPPAYVQTPMLFNPLYSLLAISIPESRQVFSYPLSSCLLFLGLGMLAAGLAMRRIQRAGKDL